MLKHLIRLSFLVMLLVPRLGTAQDTIVLNKEDTHLTAQENYRFFATNDDKISLNDIQLRLSEFRAYDDFIDTQPERFLWAKLEFATGNRQNSQNWHFLIAQSLYSNARIYISQANGQWKIYDVIPGEKAAPDVYGTNLVFPAPALRDGKNLILIRFESLRSIQDFKLTRLINHHAFEELTLDHYLTAGIFIGLLSGLILYNLVLFFLLKYLPYIFYVLGNIGLGAFVLLTSGFYDKFLHAVYGIKWWALSSLALGVGGFFLIQCFQYILNDPKRKKWIFHGLTGGSWGLLILSIALQFMPASIQFTLISAINLLAILTILLMLVEAIYAITRGSKAAIYLLVAFATLLIGMTVRVLVSLNILTLSIWLDTTLYVGIAFEVILLSLALAYRARTIEDKLRAVQQDKAKMHHLALTDDLTGFRNRRYLEKEATQHLKKSRSVDEPFSMAMLALTGLKDINSRVGRTNGDRVIQHIANDLKDIIVNIDYLIRYRGAEFIVLFPKKSEQAAEVFAHRIQRSIKSLEFPDELSRFHVGCNIGIAEIKDSEQHIEQVRQRAEIALFAAKELTEDAIILASVIEASLQAKTGHSLSPNTDHDENAASEQDSPLESDDLDILTPSSAAAAASSQTDKAEEKAPSDNDTHSSEVSEQANTDATATEGTDDDNDQDDTNDRTADLDEEANLNNDEKDLEGADPESKTS